MDKRRKLESIPIVQRSQVAYIMAASRAFSQMASTCSFIFSTSSLLPRPSWYGICASSLLTFLASFLRDWTRSKRKDIVSIREGKRNRQPEQATPRDVRGHHTNPQLHGKVKTTFWTIDSTRNANETPVQERYRFTEQWIPKTISTYLLNWMSSSTLLFFLPPPMMSSVVWTSVFQVVQLLPEWIYERFQQAQQIFARFICLEQTRQRFIFADDTGILHGARLQQSYEKLVQTHCRVRAIPTGARTKFSFLVCQSLSKMFVLCDVIMTSTSGLQLVDVKLHLRVSPSSL